MVRLFVSLVFLVSVIHAGGMVELFLLTRSIDYKEYAPTGELLDSESSDFMDIYGFEIGYGHLFKTSDSFATKVDVRYRRVEGESLYVGAVLGSDEPYGSLVSTTRNTISDFSLMIKEIYIYNEYVNFKGGVGFGRHRWERTLSSVQNEIYGWYPIQLEIGGMFVFEPASVLAFDFGLTYEKGLSPYMRLEDPAIDFTLGGVECLEASLYGIYTITGKWSFIGGYTYRRQSITRSDLIESELGTVYEPDSTDYQQEFKVGIGYSF